MTNLITKLNDQKGKPCAICNEIHIPQNRCRFDALAKKIAQLQEANQSIPSLLEAIKEAVESAQTFQALLKQTDRVHTILWEVLSEHGEVGEEIKKEFLKRTDEWLAKEHTNQDTEELKPDIEKSILKETKDKGSTIITLPDGRPIQKDS